jgi:ubiquitin carboxyl-terminal hydrolase 2/21
MVFSCSLGGHCHAQLKPSTFQVPYSEIKYPSIASPQEKSQISDQWYRARQDSVMSDIFMGQLRSTLQCNHCHHKSLSFDPFWDLSLSLRSGVGETTLEDCLAQMTEVEKLGVDEMPTCERCKQRRESTKTIRVQMLPEVLVLHLKRFRQAGYRRSKSNVDVHFPIGTLDMAPVCDEAAHGGGTRYSLYAVSVHSGGMGGGHYTAMARGPVDGQWRMYNDSHVSDVQTERVSGSGAYLLFYHKTKGRHSSIQPASSSL